MFCYIYNEVYFGSRTDTVNRIMSRNKDRCKGDYIINLGRIKRIYLYFSIIDIFYLADKIFKWIFKNIYGLFGILDRGILKAT